MLEYAANATEYWDVEQFRVLYEESGHTLNGNLGLDEEQQEVFWENVRDNLKSGKMRLLFVVDAIPKTLLRMIEFLNDQMTDIEVLGLEIKQYSSKDGRQLFVPRVVGRTTYGMVVKKVRKGKWDNDSFLEEVERVGGSALSELAKKIMDDFHDLGCRIWFGQGNTHSSIVLIYDGKYKKTQFVSVYPWTKGVYFEIDFQHFKEPFNTVESRVPLKAEFEKALDVFICETKLEGRPTFPLHILLNKQKYENFKFVIQKMITQIKAAEQKEPNQTL